MPNLEHQRLSGALRARDETERGKKSVGWAGSEVARVDADLIATVEGLEVDRAKGTVILEGRRAVDQGVLAAELFFNFVEAGGYVLDADGVECLTAGGFGDNAEYLVAPAFAGTDVGADAVDDGLGALAHLDGIGLLEAAVVVVAVGDDDEDTADGTFFSKGEHLVMAGPVEGIEERRAAARAELADPLIEQRDVVGEALRDVDLDVKALDEGEVAAMKYLTQELDGGVLLELEALADRTGGVQHDADAEGEIGLLGEGEDRDRGVAVVEQAEVLAFEAGDEAAFFVGNGEDEVYFVGLHFDGGDGPARGRCRGVGDLGLRRGGHGLRRGAGLRLDCRLRRWRQNRHREGGLPSSYSSLRSCGSLGVGRYGAEEESEDGGGGCEEP